VRVRIGPKRYRVEERSHVDVQSDVPGREVAAYIDYSGQYIMVRRGLREFHKFCALVHEIVHGYDYELQLGLSEVQTGMVATLICSFLVDNIPFLEWVLRVLKSSRNEGG